MDERLILPEVHEQVPMEDAVKGWVGWSAYGGRLTPLKSPDGQNWRPRLSAIAECPYGCSPIDVPGKTCSCGIHVTKELAPILERDVDIVGRVAAWGKIIEGSQGWRTSRAYPIELWVPYHSAPLAKSLKDAYGCEVVLKNFDIERNQP